jgi:hypothetical protein
VSPPVSPTLDAQRAEVDRLDQEIVALLCERVDAAERLRLSLTEAGLRVRSLAEENEAVGRYSGALGRTGVRIALLLMAAVPGVPAQPAVSCWGRCERASPVRRLW